MATKKTVQEKSDDTLIFILENRFRKNMKRHPNIQWETVLASLERNTAAQKTLEMMEESGGEPDVLQMEPGRICFVDCSDESPKGRRSFCYDRKAWEKRKEHKPENTAEDFAKEMGAEILNEEQYRKLQEFGQFDLKTSSWIQTPEKIRKLGGALFCDRRFDTVFTYHNGAESYYAARGFRCIIEV